MFCNCFRDIDFFDDEMKIVMNSLFFSRNHEKNNFIIEKKILTTNINFVVVYFDSIFVTLRLHKKYFHHSNFHQKSQKNVERNIKRNDAYFQS